jgi:hypothetical protein
MPGKNPASATPSPNRSQKKDCAPRTNIIAAQTIPQEIIMRAIHRRAPMRSRIMLLGISKMKYPMKNNPAPSP